MYSYVVTLASSYGLSTVARGALDVGDGRRATTAVDVLTARHGTKYVVSVTLLDPLETIHFAGVSSLERPFYRHSDRSTRRASRSQAGASKFWDQAARRSHNALSDKPLVAVTTSWDDGHALDLRLAELLDRHQVSGTFYVAPENIEIPAADRLSRADLVNLAKRFEIGAHTLTHRRLPGLSDNEARREIVGGKETVESIIGAPVTAFCYPGGQYDPRHVELVCGAGFRVARTVRRFATRLPADLLQMPTTVQAYRHLVDGPAAARHRGLSAASRAAALLLLGIPRRGRSSTAS